jgi:immune inhibitor A
MTTLVDLSTATSASLQFKTSYDIEQDWDYAYVLVDGVPTPGNITTNDNPYGGNFGNGITGISGGWVDAEFDLSAYVGAEIELTIYYLTDAYVTNPGMYIDDVSVNVDGSVVLFDDAEGDPQFLLGGFVQDEGFVESPHYYLMEWRTHDGIDQGLKHVPVGAQSMEYNKGLVVWYVDDYFTENWVGIHPGEGFLGVVDADQKTLVWSDGTVASTRYQIHDAAFSRRPSSFLSVTIDDPSLGEIDLMDYFVWPIHQFKDYRDYSTPEQPDSGRLLTPYGLKAEVVADSWDGSVGKIKLSKKSWKQYW